MIKRNRCGGKFERIAGKKKNYFFLKERRCQGRETERGWICSIFLNNIWFGGGGELFSGGVNFFLFLFDEGGGRVGGAGWEGQAIKVWRKIGKRWAKFPWSAGGRRRRGVNPLSQLASGLIFLSGGRRFASLRSGFWRISRISRRLLGDFLVFLEVLGEKDDFHRQIGGPERSYTGIFELDLLRG